MEWISVKDRLPETIKQFTMHGANPYVRHCSKQVLVLLDDKIQIRQFKIDRYLDGTENSGWDTHGVLFIPDKPTYWLSFPEPPTK